MTAAKRAPAAKKTEEIVDETIAPEGSGLESPPDGGYSLSDADEPENDAPVDPEDPYAGMSREELVAALAKAKGNARVEPPSRRATLMFAPRGNSRFYLDGKTVASWDKQEPEPHIWRQIEVKCRATLEDEVDVVHWPHKVLPDVLPPEGELGVRATPKVADVVVHQPKKPGPGLPTTSYQTSSGMNRETLGGKVN